MQTPHPAPVNALEAYRPTCSRCGAVTSLARIEPNGEPGYDLRTFECTSCGHSEVVKMKFR